MMEKRGGGYAKRYHWMHGAGGGAKGEEFLVLGDGIKNQSLSN